MEVKPLQSEAQGRPASDADLPGANARVSVIVTTYNRERYIDECMQSLLAQTRPADEIIVVDDGSTDGTPDRLVHYGPPVRLLRKANGGKSTALNLGLSEASGEWVWLFDDDDVALPDALERMLVAVQQDNGADFAYSAQIVGRDSPAGRIEPLFETPLPPVTAQGLFLYTLKTFPFRMQGMLMRRRVVLEVGGFDPDYVRSQDYEFYSRLFRHARGVALNKPTFVWRVHEGLRGPEHAAHSGSKRDEVWSRYDAKFLLRLRETLPLGCYMVPQQTAEALSLREQQWALVQRALVMASKGLLCEMATDLRDADTVSEQCGEVGMPGWLVKDVRDAANLPAFRQCLVRDVAGTIQMLATAGHGPMANAVRRGLARGLWWSWRHAGLDRSARAKVFSAMMRLLAGSLI